MMTLRNHRC